MTSRHRHAHTQNTLCGLLCYNPYNNLVRQTSMILSLLQKGVEARVQRKWQDRNQGTSKAPGQSKKMATGYTVPIVAEFPGQLNIYNIQSYTNIFIHTNKQIHILGECRGNRMSSQSSFLQDLFQSIQADGFI
ncbi:UNVERIFIED_CONTAM: hypothetical protein K2H54_029417 [Gekko kuhli]